MTGIGKEAVVAYVKYGIHLEGLRKAAET